jgi:hypothetical protein
VFTIEIAKDDDRAFVGENCLQIFAAERIAWRIVPRDDQYPLSLWKMDIYRHRF